VDIVLYEQSEDADSPLRKKADAINPIGNTWKQIAKEMLDLMHGQHGIGLAGPQVGINKRIFVVDVDGHSPHVFINPSFVETSEETAVIEEGCLSMPEVYADVKRPARVKVQAWNERGRPFNLDADGMLARAIQHEYDHLEGILFFDRLNDRQRNKFLTKWAKAKKKLENQAKHAHPKFSSRSGG
jgi:peptide deformylase